MPAVVGVGEFNMHAPKKNHSSSFRVALAGIITALSVLIMAMGSILPIATFTAPALAGVCLLPVVIELGKKYAFLCYVAVCFLSFLFVADKEIMLLYIVLLGYYPIVQPLLLRVPSKILRFIIKIVLCTAGALLIYSLLLMVFASPALRQELSGYSRLLQMALLFAGNITFLLYDLLLQKVKIIYQYRFQGRFFK